ncbi:MAG: ATPase, T2SS/T4P/T4SS family, partial [bacterium]
MEIDGEGAGALAAHLGASLPAWRDLARDGYGGLLRGRLAEHPSGLHLADSGSRQPLNRDERIEDFLSALSEGYDGTILILQGWEEPVPSVFGLVDALLLAVGPGPVALARAVRWQRRVREAHLFETHIRAVAWGPGTSSGLMSETLGWPAWKGDDSLVESVLTAPIISGRPASGDAESQMSTADPILIRRRLHREVVERLDRVRQAAGGDGVKPGPATRESVVREVEAVLAESATAVRSRDDREALARDLLADLLGYGPLETLLADPDITEILVNGPGQIFVEKRGRLEPSLVRFPDVDALRVVIERILGPVGRRADESAPMADARLPDGSRVNVVLPPLS